MDKKKKKSLLLLITRVTVGDVICIFLEDQDIFRNGELSIKIVCQTVKRCFFILNTCLLEKALYCEEKLATIIRYYQYPIGSDERLTLETSASESLFVGQFTLSTQLINPNYLVVLPTDAAPQFL